MPRLDKAEIIENLAAAIWPMGGGTRTWQEALDDAKSGDPAPNEAVNRCYAFADSTYLILLRQIKRS